MANNNVTFQIMTLNVHGPHGLGNADNRRLLIGGFQEQLQQCSVIFVQECNGEDQKNLMNILGDSYQIRPQPGNIDIAIIWRPGSFDNVEVIGNQEINEIVNAIHGFNK